MAILRDDLSRASSEVKRNNITLSPNLIKASQSKLFQLSACLSTETEERD